MAKRLIDVVLGTLLALLALPVILVCAIGVMLTLRASPFFVQRRIGRSGRSIAFVKLRTLPKDFPHYADKYHLDGVSVPWFPHLLRRLHLDELPQLFLVPLGTMSLVGPRPEMPVLHARLDDAFATQRTAVRPGCTGLWQIGADCDRLIGEAPNYDRYYLQHRSVRLDLWIMARTMLLLVDGRVVVTLDQIPDWATARRAPMRATMRVSSPEAEIELP
jgi:lipopolysaccharide/colanic/teichoic acid biosynthesis glycosyltransferase